MYIHAAISAGNPELFLFSALIRAQQKNVPLDKILEELHDQVMQSGHPVLIHLFHPKNVKHYPLQRRIERCFAYFPKLKTAFLNSPKIIRSYQLELVDPRQVSDNVIEFVEKEFAAIEDNLLQRTFQLTEQNYLISLERYFYHYGMSDSLCVAFNMMNIAGLEAPQLSRWVALQNAHAQISKRSIQRVLNYPSRVDQDILMQFSKFKNKLDPFVWDPGVISQVENQIKDLYEKIEKSIKSSNFLETRLNPIFLVSCSMLFFLGCFLIVGKLSHCAPNDLGPPLLSAALTLIIDTLVTLYLKAIATISDEIQNDITENLDRVIERSTVLLSIVKDRHHSEPLLLQNSAEFLEQLSLASQRSVWLSSLLEPFTRLQTQLDYKRMSRDINQDNFAVITAESKLRATFFAFQPAQESFIDDLQKQEIQRRSL